MSFCPVCRSDRPAAAFLKSDAYDPCGSWLRCRSCIREDRAALAFLKATTGAEEGSPVALARRAVRARRQRATRAAAVYARSLAECPAPARVLVAA